jgi:hypothetical protein
MLQALKSTKFRIHHGGVVSRNIPGPKELALGCTGGLAEPERDTVAWVAWVTCEAITDSEVAAVTLQRYIYTCKKVHEEGVLYHLSKPRDISGHLHRISRRRTVKWAGKHY